MIPLLLPPEEHTLGRAVPKPYAATTCRDQFAAWLRHAPYAVIRSPQAQPSPAFVKWCRDICGLYPDVRIVLLVRPDLDLIRSFASVPLADLVWDLDFPGCLEEIVPRHLPAYAYASQLLERAAMGFASCSAPIRRAVQRLFDTAMPPVCRVRDLVRSVPYSETTLRTAWMAELGDVNPKALVDWVLLVRVLQHSLLRPHFTTLALAAEFGMHERTLERLSMRVTSRTIGVNRRPRGRETTLEEFRAFRRDSFRPAERRRSQSG